MFFRIRYKYYKEFVRQNFTYDGDASFSKKIYTFIKKGFYVDVGCYHPLKGSHTSYLYRNGWKGLNLDISAESIEMFKIFRPKDTSLVLGLSDKGGVSDAYLNKDISTISSINKSLVEIIGINNYKIKRTIKTTTLKDLRKKQNLNKINFLKIDCEGHDELILSQSSIEDLEADFLCFEVIPTDKTLKNEIEKKNNYLEFFDMKSFSKKILDYFDHYDNNGFTYLMKSKYLNK
tara:strand:- start:1734 stop:2432 length:699 start_codon:yes stop_codon:yes gene_type:complete